MKKLIVASAVLVVALVAPGALAAKKPSSRAYVFKANIGGVSPYSLAIGKARLVDNKRRDKVTINVRGLAAGQTYPWHVHVIDNPTATTNPCRAGAPQGPIVPFSYKRLTANSSGNASANGTSRTFKATLDDLYYVNVHDPATGTPIACGILNATKKTKSALKAKRRSSRR